MASIMVCIGVGVCFATSRGTEGEKLSDKASLIQAEVGEKLSVDSKWHTTKVAGDCVLLEKKQPNQDEAQDENTAKDIYDSPEVALKVLESDGEDWGMIASDENYVVLARHEQAADGDLTSESDAKWDEKLQESNNSILKEYITDDSVEFDDMLKKLNGIPDRNHLVE